MDLVNRSRHIAGAGTPAAAWHADAALAAVPPVAPDALVAPGTRVVVVAPHPDDEILTCGALLHLLAQRGDMPLIVAVTDGEGSHPGSSAWPQQRLREVRARETVAALACLGIGAPHLLRLGIADGGVTAAQDGLTERLAAILQPGDLVVTTWCFDGHPDHEATARACAAAAGMRGARLLQAPVWGWHWSAPGDGAMPLARAVKLVIPAEALASKRAALLCFHSQIEVDASSGAAPILPGFALERLLQPLELYFTDQADAQLSHFETLYAASDDPWDVRGAWYEQRKRAIVLASLARPRYRNAFEPGCGNGEMSAALAARCDRLLAADGATSALAAARRRLPDSHVGFEQRLLPQDWPGGESFDLIVLSELAYYFRQDQVEAMLAQASACLAPDGELVLCHYRHDFDDRITATAAIHAAASRTPGLRRTLHHEDEDFLLEVWRPAGGAP